MSDIRRPHGVRLYGNEHVCTGPHVWGKPENGIIMCELCYTCLPEKEVPKWEQRTREREAIEDDIRLEMQNLREAEEQVAKGIWSKKSDVDLIRSKLNYLYGRLKEWRP